MEKPPQKNSPGQAFLPALESARGLAAVAVVIFHFTAYPGYAQWKIRPIANAYLCVDFFFVLSGYILARGYIGKIPNLRAVLDFGILRLGRIWPLHAFYLLAFMLLALKLSLVWSPKDFWVQFVMLHATPLATAGFQFNPPSWSISAEWICYVVFAACALWSSTGMRLVACMVLAVLGFVSTCLQMSSSLNDLTFGTGIARGVYGFFVGASLYLLTSRRPVEVPGWTATSLLAGYLIFKPADALLDLCAPLVFAPVVIWLASESAQRTWLSRQFVVRVGTYSYSIYLGHILLNAIAMKVLHVVWPGEPPFIIALPVALSFTFLGSFLTYNLIEAPARQLFRGLIVTKNENTRS